LEAILIDLLHGMTWRLVDATPHHIILDSGFRTGLQNHLGCGSEKFDLSDLHPSLANLDHVCYIVSTVRDQKFTNGTGFKGMVLNTLFYSN
jgi:hypothetical protein